jgi:hypothetical protein
VSSEVLSGIVILSIYLLVILGSAGLVLWLQRRYVLHPDEDQSFLLPFVAAFGCGIIYLWTVIQLDV